jgi:hypothetical protein
MFGTNLVSINYITFLSAVTWNYFLKLSNVGKTPFIRNKSNKCLLAP